MPKLFIPTLETQLTLDQDWTFVLQQERRNFQFIKVIVANGVRPIKIKHYRGCCGCHPQTPPLKCLGRWYCCVHGKEDPSVALCKGLYQVSLPKDTTLTVDRIYIRKGNEDFDSITFFVQNHPLWGSNSGSKTFNKKWRFWVSLDDANNIVYR